LGVPVEQQEDYLITELDALKGMINYPALAIFLEVTSSSCNYYIYDKEELMAASILYNHLEWEGDDKHWKLQEIKDCMKHHFESRSTKNVKYSSKVKYITKHSLIHSSS